jgi:hypothetical protein
MAPRIKNFSRRSGQLRWSSREYHRRLAAERRALGLTTRGTVRKLLVWPELHGRSDREQHTVRMRFYRRRKSKFGKLTTKGNPRRNYSWPELVGLTGPMRARVRVRLWLQKKVRRERLSTLNQQPSTTT